MKRKNESVNESHPITRREFTRLVSMFSFTAAFGGLETLAFANQIPTFEKLKRKAEKIHLAQAKLKPEYVIRMGVSGFLPKIEKIMPVGHSKFGEELTKRTNGRIKVEIFGGNSLCTEMSCPQKLMAGTIHISSSSTQNAAHTFKFLNALDFPYLFPSRAAVNYFMYSKTSEKYFREVLRKLYDIEFLWTSPELRNIYLGAKYKDKPRVRVPKQIEGAKIRVTGTDLGRIGLEQMGVNPIPLNWSETLEGLRSGVVDGMETCSCATAAFNMAPVVSQDVGIGFITCTECSLISYSFLKKLPTKLQEVIYETAYDMQKFTQMETERALVEKVGYQDPPRSGTVYSKYGVRVNLLNKEELMEWKKMADPRVNPEPYKEWRGKLDKMCGFDVYEVYSKCAQEIPEDTPAQEVKPQRWWT